MARTLQEIIVTEKPEVVEKAKAMASEMLLNIHLAELREKVALTQKELAGAMGVKQPTIAGMEKIGHFHFLKDIGKDLLECDYSTIRRHLTRYRIRPQLRKIAKTIRQAIEDAPDARQSLDHYLGSKQLEKLDTPLKPLLAAYLIISWIVEAKSESNGFGFPFDRPHLDFYLRLQEAYPELKALKQPMGTDASLLPLMPLRNT